MKIEHFELCAAPICAGDKNKDYKREVKWFPGESVCGIKMQRFQKNQRRINKLVTKETFKHVETYFTADSLERISRVTNSTKGKRDKGI